MKKLDHMSKSMLSIVAKTGKQQHLSLNALHKNLDYPLPNMWADYATAKALHSISTCAIPSSIFHNLTLNSLNNNRFKGQHFTSTAKKKIGKNSLSNRISNVSAQMNADWLSMTKPQFKMFAKKTFITDKLKNLIP
jgi:hypothetical protein